MTSVLSNNSGYVGASQKRALVSSTSSVPPPLPLSTTPPAQDYYGRPANMANNQSASRRSAPVGGAIGNNANASGYTPYPFVPQTPDNQEILALQQRLLHQQLQLQQQQFPSQQMQEQLLLQQMAYGQEFLLQQQQQQALKQDLSPQPPIPTPVSSPNTTPVTTPSPHTYSQNLANGNSVNSNLSVSCSPATTPPTSSPTPSPTMAGWGPPPPLMLPKLGSGYNLENGDVGLMPIQYPSEEETCLFPILNEFDPSNINDSPNVPISPDRDDFSPQRQPQQPQLMPPILQSQQQMVQIQAQTQQNVPQFQPQQSQGPQQSYQQPSLKPLSQVPPHMESGIPGSAQSASLPAARAPPPALSPVTRLPPPSPTVMGNAEPSRDLSSVQVAFRQQSNKPVELRLLGVPQKSRVETQIRLCVQLVASGGQVGSGGLRWKYLYLPPDMCNNDLRSVNAHAPPSVSPVKGHDLSATLNVQTKVLCASDNREVLMCMGCVQRERRSLERKKHNVAPTPSQPNSRPATPSCNSAGISTGGIGWSEMIEQEQRKIVQFHSNPLIDFTSGEAIISLRITCYCRHHNEKVGFRIQLTLVDPISGEVVASSVSSPVLITDDHKTSVKRTAKRPRIDPDYEDKHTTPIIQKVVPNIGPIAGGIEVTLLGSGFSSSNTVHFGPYIAPSLNCWNATTIVCTLPPSGREGPVQVTINGTDQSPACEPAIFTYRDDSDHRLLEIALQLIGLKFNGHVESAKSVAMQILSLGQPQGTPSNTPTSNSSTIQDNINQVSALPFQEMETVVLNAMRIVDSMDGKTVDVTVKDKFGRNMLHYAAMKGYVELGSWCLKKGGIAVVNTKDIMGNAPLHYACFYARTQFTKLLLQHKADLSLQNLSNCTPCDMAQLVSNATVLPVPPPLPPLRHHLKRAFSSKTAPTTPHNLPPIFPPPTPLTYTKTMPSSTLPLQPFTSTQPAAIRAVALPITKVGEYRISIESKPKNAELPVANIKQSGAVPDNPDSSIDLKMSITQENANKDTTMQKEESSGAQEKSNSPFSFSFSKKDDEKMKETDAPNLPSKDLSALPTTKETSNLQPTTTITSSTETFYTTDTQVTDDTTGTSTLNFNFTPPSPTQRSNKETKKLKHKTISFNKSFYTKKPFNFHNPYVTLCTSPTAADIRQKQKSNNEQQRLSSNFSTHNTPPNCISVSLPDADPFLHTTTLTLPAAESCMDTDTYHHDTESGDNRGSPANSAATIASEHSINHDSSPLTGDNRRRNLRSAFRGGGWWHRHAPKALLVAGLGIVGVCAVLGLLFGPVGFDWNGTHHIVNSSASVETSFGENVAIYYTLLCALCVTSVVTMSLAFAWFTSRRKPSATSGKLRVLGMSAVIFGVFDLLFLSLLLAVLFAGQ